MFNISLSSEGRYRPSSRDSQGDKVSGHKINPFLASLSWSPLGLRTAGDPAGPATRVWREPDTETRPHGTSQRASAHVHCEHSRQQPTSVRSRGKRQECGLRLHLRVCVFVAQSCPTLCDPKDCSLPDSFAHGDSPGKNTGVGCHLLLQGIFPTQGSNPGLLHCRQILYLLTYPRSPSF